MVMFLIKGIDQHFGIKFPSIKLSVSGRHHYILGILKYCPTLDINSLPSQDDPPYLLPESIPTTAATPWTHIHIRDS